MEKFAESVHSDHDGIVALRLRQTSDQIHSDDLPDVLGYLGGNQFSSRSGRKGLGPVAPVTAFDILGYVSGDPWPPVVPRYQLQGFPSAWMTCHLCIMMGLDNLPSEILVLGHIDFASEHVVFDRVPMYVVTVAQLELSYLLPSVSVSVSEPVVESSSTHSVFLFCLPELPHPTELWPSGQGLHKQ